MAREHNFHKLSPMPVSPSLLLHLLPICCCNSNNLLQWVSNSRPVKLGSDISNNSSNLWEEVRFWPTSLRPAPPTISNISPMRLVTTRAGDIQEVRTTFGGRRIFVVGAAEEAEATVVMERDRTASTEARISGEEISSRGEDVEDSMIVQAAPAQGDTGRAIEGAVKDKSLTPAPPLLLVTTLTSLGTWGQRPGVTRRMFLNIRA